MIVAPYFDLNIKRFTQPARAIFAQARKEAATTSELGQPESRLIAPIHIAQALQEVVTNGAGIKINGQFPESGSELYAWLTPGSCYFLQNAVPKEGEVTPLDFARALLTVRDAIGINEGLGGQLMDKGINLEEIEKKLASALKNEAAT